MSPFIHRFGDSAAAQRGSRRDFVGAETSQRHGDLVAIFAEPLDVAGWVVISVPVLGFVQ